MTPLEFRLRIDGVIKEPLLSLVLELETLLPPDSIKLKGPEHLGLLVWVDKELIPSSIAKKALDNFYLSSSNHKAEHSIGLIYLSLSSSYGTYAVDIETLVTELKNERKQKLHEQRNEDRDPGVRGPRSLSASPRS